MDSLLYLGRHKPHDLITFPGNEVAVLPVVSAVYNVEKELPGDRPLLAQSSLPERENCRGILTVIVCMYGNQRMPPWASFIDNTEGACSEYISSGLSGLPHA
jgi:hypothetical protein